MPRVRRRASPQNQRNPPPASATRLSTLAILPTASSVVPTRVPSRNPTAHPTISTVRSIPTVPRTVVPAAVTRTIVRSNPTVVTRTIGRRNPTVTIAPAVVPPQHGRRGHHRRSAAVPVVRSHGGRVPRQ